MNSVFNNLSDDFMGMSGTPPPPQPLSLPSSAIVSVWNRVLQTNHTASELLVQNLDDQQTQCILLELNKFSVEDRETISAQALLLINISENYFGRLTILKVLSLFQAEERDGAIGLALSITRGNIDATAGVLETLSMIPAPKQANLVSQILPLLKKVPVHAYVDLLQDFCRIAEKNRPAAIVQAMRLLPLGRYIGMSFVGGSYGLLLSPFIDLPLPTNEWEELVTLVLANSDDMFAIERSKMLQPLAQLPEEEREFTIQQARRLNRCLPGCLWALTKIPQANREAAVTQTLRLASDEPHHILLQLASIPPEEWESCVTHTKRLWSDTNIHNLLSTLKIVHKIPKDIRDMRLTKVWGQFGAQPSTKLYHLLRCTDPKNKLI